MENEIARYATDRWDCELLTSYGWIECVGCADRSAYDLTVHSRVTSVPLLVRERRDQPLKIEEWTATIDKKKIGPKFKKDTRTVENAVEMLSQELKEKLSLELKEKGKIEIDVTGVGSGIVELDSSLLSIEKKTRTEFTREYIPNVIEPSFALAESYTPSLNTTTKPVRAINLEVFFLSHLSSL
jgi:glycyl-tRNA synthetase